MSDIVYIKAGNVTLEGSLILPPQAKGLIVFVHGSGSSRYSPRNQYVARVMQEANFATLLFDLLTAKEELIDVETRQIRFDIPLLAQRVIHTLHWLKAKRETKNLKIGLIGSSTGAAAALVAAADPTTSVTAVVSRSGRPDLAGEALQKVIVPTLLIVGEYDDIVIGLNEEAKTKFKVSPELTIVPGATHLFEESAALEDASRRAALFFSRHLC